MRSNMRIATALFVTALSTAGCQNPFDPSCDVELTSLTSNSGHYIVVYSGDTSGSTVDFDRWKVAAGFLVRNKVSAVITSVLISYTDLDGNPVTAYKATGGRSFKTTFRLAGVSNNNQGEGQQTSQSIYVVDQRVLADLTSGSYPTNKFMFADIVFRGEDENGYDVRLEGRIAIYYYQ